MSLSPTYAGASCATYFYPSSTFILDSCTQQTPCLLVLWTIGNWCMGSGISSWLHCFIILLQKPPLFKYQLSCILAQHHRKEQTPIQVFTASLSFQECTAAAHLLTHGPKNWGNHCQCQILLFFTILLLKFTTSNSKITNFCSSVHMEPKRKKCSFHSEQEYSHKYLLKRNLTFWLPANPKWPTLNLTDLHLAYSSHRRHILNRRINSVILRVNRTTAFLTFDKKFLLPRGLCIVYTNSQSNTGRLKWGSHFRVRDLLLHKSLSALDL